MKNTDFNIIKTGDGTYSVYSKEYQEAMHSSSGAYEEALLKNVYPSGILEASNKELFILDIGFGLGYNILALITEFGRKKTDQKLNIISLEKDFSHQSFMNTILFNDERDLVYSEIKACISKGKMDFERYSLEIKFGDARQSIKAINDIIFDAVFHDPYSPSKNPELWSVEFFAEVKKIMRNNAVLTTYSSALQIRMALLEAGFIIGIGPSVGKKREGTLASPRDGILKISGEDINSLKANIKSTPYRDCGLKNSRKDILNLRLNEIKEKRQV